MTHEKLLAIALASLDRTIALTFDERRVFVATFKRKLAAARRRRPTTVPRT